MIKGPALFEWTVTSDPQSPRLYPVGHGSRTQQAWRERLQSIAEQGRAPGWGLKDLPLRTRRQMIHWWKTSGCILTQNKLFKEETHFKSSVFTAGKLWIRSTDTIKKKLRKWLLGRGQESKERVKRRDSTCSKAQLQKNQDLSGGGKEGHGRESRSLHLSRWGLCQHWVLP